MRLFLALLFFASSVFAQGGRLAPVVSGAVVDNADATAATTIAYAPASGSTVPVFNGSAMQWIAFTSSPSDAVGKTLALGSSWAASSVHDVYMAYNGGTIALCTGAWSGGSPAVADALYDGLKVNSASFTCRTGQSTTITCAASECTYLGTVQMDATAGQISCLYSRALNSRCGIWNQYNRKTAILQVGDNWCTASNCVYQIPAGMSCALGSCANNATVLVGRAGEVPLVEIIYNRRIKHTAGGTGTQAAHYFGVGWGTTSTITGMWGGNNTEFFDAWTSSRVYGGTAYVAYSPVPFQGSVVATAMDYCQSYSGCEAWNVDGNFVMTATYRR